MNIAEIGEMHHDPAKNVLFNRVGVEEIARRLSLSDDQVRELLASAKKKMYSTRLTRPTPYVDKTIYVGWNAMCVSAYLSAARVLEIPDAQKFALRSLDRLLSEGWRVEQTATSTSTASDKRVRPTLSHVIAYSDPKAEHRDTTGVLEDYAFTVIACLDAYEATSDLSYFRFARKITDAMIASFFDPEAGGFFDTASTSDDQLAALRYSRHAPPQALSGFPHPRRYSRRDDCATAPACLHQRAFLYRDQAQRTLEVLRRRRRQIRNVAATYALAVVHYTQPHAQVVIVGNDEAAVGFIEPRSNPSTSAGPSCDFRPTQSSCGTCRQPCRKRSRTFRPCVRGVRLRSCVRIHLSAPRVRRRRTQ